MNNERTALVIGSTGLIGNYVKKELLENPAYKKVNGLVRKPTNETNEKWNEVVINFDDLDTAKGSFKVDEVYICLGTTKKKAGTKESFKKVDYDYVVKVASLARQLDVKSIAIVSAIGADSKSSFFYNQVKGQMEEEVTSIGIPSTYFFRPSLLLGERNEFRFGERAGEAVGKVIQPLLRGKWKKYRSIHGQTVAKAMVRFLKDSRAGVHVVESDLIEEIGNL